MSVKLFDEKKNTTITYTCDDNGNLISEIGEYGTDKVETYYDYTVENRLQAVYDADELLMAVAYTYGVFRLTEDRFTGESNFYLCDSAGNVAGITDQDGYLWQSYRYDALGNATFGSPQYDNEYTFNAESYNPNIQSQYLRARYYDMVKGNFLTEDSYLGDIRNPLTLNRYSYCIGNPLFYSDLSGHIPMDEYSKIYNYSVDNYYGKEGKDWLKEYYKRVRHLEAMDYINNYNLKEGNDEQLYNVSAEFVINYDYGLYFDNPQNMNDFDNMLGKATYLKIENGCYSNRKGMRRKPNDEWLWLDLYYNPTVEGNGRPVSIPDDRPRKSGDYWGSPSWKSYEAVYGPNTNYVNGHGEEAVIKNWDIYPDSLGMIRAKKKGEEDAIERYVIAVGPRVVNENYLYTGKNISATDMNYGVEIDVILRDSNYNVYFVPAIVGDIKEHTLDSQYAKKPLNGEKGIEPNPRDPENGVYQTGVSWVNREIPDYVREDEKQYPNGAIVEFLRKPEESIDEGLIGTPEFDILGLLVYDK